MIDDEELDAIAIESNHTIEIDSFVPRAQIDERFFDSPYYICPNDQIGQEAFALIREAMRGSRWSRWVGSFLPSVSESSCYSPGKRV
jgi:non-homologous end joining protein Ku